MRYTAVMIAAVAMGCGPDPDTQMAKKVPSDFSSSRVSIERVGVISDDLAYQGRRGIYIIRDSETGTELVGISGVGVSTLGSHPVGKIMTEDER